MKRILEYQDKQLTYELVRKNVKNLNLRLSRDGSIHVSAPYFVSQTQIEHFLLRAAPRILLAREKLQQKTNALSLTDDTVFLRGQRHTVCVRRGNKNRAQMTEDGPVLYLKEPSDNEAREKLLQKLINDFAREWVQESCERLYPIFQRMGVKKPELKFRRMKRRWGSCCCSTGILTFNTVLAQVPAECLDYVVIHEYCHFIHPNHSSAFYALMTEVMPAWKKRKKELENYAALL